VGIIFTFALNLVAMATNYSDFFLFFGSFEIKKFCLFPSRWLLLQFINPMTYHGPGLKKKAYII